MGKKVLIIGNSGTGKSASMRNFKKDEILIINVAGKDMPFKEPKGGFEKIVTDSYREIKKAISETKKKVIVIDDTQYLMANEFMRRATEKGYDKFTEIAQNFWKLQQNINELPNDVVVYELSHIERDQDGNEKMKTIGKMLDEKITVEGMFSIVLKSVVNDGHYYFQTQNNGKDTCKSPIGLFNSTLIDNDLKKVDEIIREYYDLKDSSVDSQASSILEQEQKEDKTLAEKIADVHNNEPEAKMPKENPVELVEEAPKPSRSRTKKTKEVKVEEPIEEVKDEAPFEVKEEPEEVIVEDTSEPVKRVRRQRKERV